MALELLRGHANFRRDYLGEEGQFLRRLAGEGQSPGALYVGCSDSRVVPELLTASSPGDLFVVRNVANLVPPLEHADASVGAALDYAVGHLHVPHIIVCGHYGCGGVRAMLDGGTAVHDLASLSEWLAGLRPAVERARHPEEETWWRQAVEENVVEQLANLTTFPEVERALEGGRLQMHGWVYDMTNLELRVYDAPSDAFRPANDLLGR